MNHIYKSVYNPRLGLWQAVAENARGKSKSQRSASRLLAGAVALASGLAAQQAKATEYAIDGGSTVTVTSVAPQPWVGTDTLNVGQTTSGTLNMESGATVTSGGFRIGHAAGTTGAVNVSDGGTSWTHGGLSYIGHSGTGILNIQNGATVDSSGGSIEVGAMNTGTGTITVTGSGSSWTGFDSLSLGNSATLSILNGGSVSGASSSVAAGIGKVATAIVDGSGSSWALSSDLLISDNSTLNIRNGASVSSLNGTINSLIGSAGTVNVTGSGSSWNITSGPSPTNKLYVGLNGGSAILNIREGAAVSGVNSYVGGYFGGSGATHSTGTVTVDGNGSSWASSDALYVGVGTGTGTVNIQNAGHASNGAAYIGWGTGAVGNVTVDGSGSSFTSGNLILGDTDGISSGTGTLTIQNGGSLSSSDTSDIGSATGSTGTVTVTGSGSTWTSSGHIKVGYHGTGTLSIQNAGVLNNFAHGSAVIFSSNGTLNLNGTAGARGVLTTNYVLKSAGTAAVNWSGGILRAASNQANYLQGISAGDITIGSNGAFFDTNGYNVGVTTASLLAGTGGLTKLGAGTLTLAGANTYSGNTTVSAGTLAFGSYSQSAGQTLSVGASNNSSYGKLAVTGTATFNAGANLAVDVASANSLAVGQTLSNVIFAGTLSASTFAVTDNSALFNFKAVLNGNAVDLSVERGITAQGAVAEAGLDSAAGAAAVLDTLLNGSTTGDMATVMAAFGALGTNREVARAAAQTLPQQSGMSAVQGILGSFNQVLQSRQGSDSGNALGESSGDILYASASALPPEEVAPSRQAWARAFGSRADQANHNGTSGFEANTWGLAFGSDTLLGQDLNQRTGMAYAYATTQVNGLTELTGAAQNANIDSHVLAVFGTRALNPNWQLNWQTDLGISNNKGSRGINFGGLNRVASSEYWGYSAHGGLGLDRKMALNAYTHFSTALRADYTWMRSQAYTETGAGALNLLVDAQTQEALVLGTEAQISHMLKSGARVSAYLGVGFDTLNKRSTMVSTYAGAPGQSFQTTGAEPSPWKTRAGMAYAMGVAKDASVVLRYDVESRDALLNQSLALKATWVF